jgi:ribosomal protein S18 acetylase RimI-like enzyme
MTTIDIQPTRDFLLIRDLFLDYVAALGVDLSFQNFDDELAHLDRFYEVILVARVDGEPAGCIALRKLERRVCEMKRLFVRPHFRRLGLGRKLVMHLIDEARRRGFTHMRLDTLPSMNDAIALYETLGFHDIAPYRFNPIEGSRFLELAL